jgi:hypothetical protein
MVAHLLTGNFLAVFEEFGSHVPRDGGSGDALGAFWVPNCLDPSTMTRSFARTGYYNPAAKRRNLHLLTGKTVTKVLFQGKTATGVQVSKSSHIRNEYLIYTTFSLAHLEMNRFGRSRPDMKL